ncbi:exodeoxyribonuclease VII small subunit [Litoribacter populi]|uniref:exodeoxyribonuclease VII small subunit n=1 Tax=Litoribacter populi TaxID=2598460 RepID=UPI00117E07FC|nr:exodeoxyribonuclease VII small subunit [Litoribacter populi]
MENSISYDQALARIEEIVQSLEQDNKGIDELSAMVKEASGLIKSCKSRLKMTEEDILKAFEEKEG